MKTFDKKQILCTSAALLLATALAAPIGLSIAYYSDSSYKKTVAATITAAPRPDADPTQEEPGIETFSEEERLYQVRPGDTLSLLAKKFNISTEVLAAYNGLDVTTKLHAGMILRIPCETYDVEATTTPEPTETDEQERLYQVRPGDTLSLLAKKFNISTEVLAAYNGLDVTTKLHAGMILRIPPVDYVPTEPAATPEPTEAADVAEPASTTNANAEPTTAPNQE